MPDAGLQQDISRERPMEHCHTSKCWNRMEAHFWAMHLNEANTDCTKFIPDDAQRHPIKMTQEHKQSVTHTQEQEEWPSDDDAHAAAPDPSGEDGSSKQWNPAIPASSDPCLDDLVGNLISSATLLSDYVRKKPDCRRQGTTASSAVRRRSRSPRRSRRSRSMSPGSAYEDSSHWREREATRTARDGRPPW